MAKRLDALYEPGRRSGAWRSTSTAAARRSPSPAGGRRCSSARRPDAIFVARPAPNGTLVPAGSAELGLTGEERVQLRSALEQRRTATRRRARRVSSGIWVDLGFHGPQPGPLRDAVMHAVRLQP